MLARLWNKAKGLLAPAEDAAHDAEPLFQQAVHCHRQGRLAEAEQLYGQVLAMERNHVGALNLLGVLAGQLNDRHRAVELIGRAVELDPSRPGLHSNLALALNDVGRGREAVESCDRAIALDPHCVEAHSNKGNSLWGLGQREAALESYARAIEAQPDHAQTHWNEGFLRLQLGQFEIGWPKHEWRWQLPHVQAYKRNFVEPLWLGKEDLHGRTILLHAEQGLGDTLQFCRYVKTVSDFGATVILEVQPQLKSLLANLEGASTVVARGEALPRFDLQCPLWSLPLAFGTTYETIPAPLAYVRPDPAIVDRWRSRLGPRRLGPQSGLRIGIAWMGSNGDRRSIPLAEVLKLKRPGVEFVSLQKELSASDRKHLEGTGDIRVMADEFADFSDTAGLVEAMDLVVTIDTSVAHLAGALGKRTWVLLAYNPDWRWFLDRSDSPWYPNVRLFRQPKPEDWASAVDEVKTELDKL